MMVKPSRSMKIVRKMTPSETGGLASVASGMEKRRHSARPEEAKAQTHRTRATAAGSVNLQRPSPRSGIRGVIGRPGGALGVGVLFVGRIVGKKEAMKQTVNERPEDDAGDGDEGESAEERIAAGEKLARAGL